MRKRLLHVLTLLLLFSNIGFSQLAPHANCGQDNYVRSTQNASSLASFNEIYQRAVAQTSGAKTRDFEIYQIPVVVHVVYSNADEYISEERINEQLVQLNKDFRRLNEDAEKVRIEFEEVVGDPGIEFQLAKINWISTDTIFKLDFDISTLTYNFPDHVKSTALGGSDPWDTREFLNIWVCPIVGDLIFGYAYPPSQLDNWPIESKAPSADVDGIVINYKAFGGPPPVFSTNTNDRVILKGRTLTHEVGHYLGLRHPWGDSEIGVYQCFLDDGLSDTPSMKDPSFDSCDLTKNTCGDVFNDLPDMIENFMDFSEHDCQNSFTNQQIDVMRFVLKKHRRALRVKTLQVKSGSRALTYPNPTDGIVKVVLKKDNDTDYQIHVTNVLSHSFVVPITHYEGPMRSYKVDLSGLTPGVYFVKFIGEQHRFTERIVLR